MKRWISNGAEHAFSSQLVEIYEILNKHLLFTRVIDKELNKDWSKDEDFEVMRQQLLLSSLSDFSIYKVYGIMDTARILMCIDLEMMINKLCYYNLDSDVFEAIEKLDIVNKMIIAVYSINKKSFKGTKHYEYTREFKDFRNSFAHGKVQEITYKEKNSDDIKTVKLKDNRISGEKYEILYDKSLIHQLNDFLLVCDKYTLMSNYLNEINQFDETIADLEDMHSNRFFIKEIKKRCEIIDKDLELDSDIKKSLQLILDRLYVDIIRVK